MAAANKPRLIIATQEQSCKLPNYSKEVKIPDLKKGKTLDFIKQKQCGQTEHIYGLQFVLGHSVSGLGKACFVNEVFSPKFRVCSSLQIISGNQRQWLSVWGHRDKWDIATAPKERWVSAGDAHTGKGWEQQLRARREGQGGMWCEPAHACSRTSYSLWPQGP